MFRVRIIGESLQNLAKSKRSVNCLLLHRKSSSTRSDRRSTKDTHKNVLKPETEDQSLIRNIGIMAHIDAGKTTTTERMLYYSGFTRHLGDVDDGDTVMDYMEQERNRGITIQSAAITFFWNKHKINLIDTPGHVDFTLEVERALRVLDGAVTVLDASAGVEAQTMTVWQQANRYKVPRIAYLNKMDKYGANFQASVESMKQKLKTLPLVTQLPIGAEKDFVGIIDLVNMEKLLWNQNSRDGRTFERKPLSESQDADLWIEALDARTLLIEQLADLNDVIADHVINDVDMLDIPSEDLVSALRQVTIEHKAVPTLCGSSFKNKGVQPLLDAIINYLPNPTEIKHEFVEYYKDTLCALAFKIIHDKQRGPLTFLRIYEGDLTSGNNLYNVNRECTEKSSRLLQVYANEHKELSTVGSGNIVAVAGLKQTITGDTLVNNLTAANAAKKAYKTRHKLSDAEDTPVLAAVTIPDPVFFCSIEPPSQAFQKDLDHALACLTREDPSLTVRLDEETGETILAGMGELHLEIIKDRIKKEYKVDAYMGELQIAYRETINDSGAYTDTVEILLGDQKHRVTLSLSVHPNSEKPSVKQITMDPDPSSEMTTRLRRQQIHAINKGMVSSLERGPILGFKLVDVEVKLHDIVIKYGTSLPMVTAAVSQTIQKAVRQATPQLLEPMMRLEIHTTEDYYGRILSDLTRKRSHIVDMGGDLEDRYLITLTPLSELMGYSTSLRTLTSGTATFSMELAHYEPMNEMDQRLAIQKVKGFIPSSL